MINLRLVTAAVFLICAAHAQDAPQTGPFTGKIPPPQYQNVRSFSLYVAMTDGGRLAVDVAIPEGLPPGTRLPTILKVTRYGRAATETRKPDFWAQYGFAHVMVDERGTGASFGTLRFGKAAVADIRDVIDWIVKQPWSNGRIGSAGISYEGNTAELTAATGQAAVGAVAPLFDTYDYYALVRPGGVFNDWLMRAWTDLSAALDGGRTARPVDEDRGGGLMKAAIAEHAGNPDLYKVTKQAEFQDDPLVGLGASYGELSAKAFASITGSRGAPMLVVASWMDASSAAGALERFRKLPNPQTVYIGSWSHSWTHDANPFGPSDNVYPNLEQRVAKQLLFFNRQLKEESAPTTREHVLHYYTMGENAWHVTDVWPPRGVKPASYMLDSGGKLSPAGGGTSIPIVVRPADMGSLTRWRAMITGQNVNYSAALERMRTLSSFTMAPLPAPVEITGAPILRLRLQTKAADPAVFAYLVAVRPGGETVYLTKGALRLMHGKPDSTEDRLHSYRRKDARADQPGKPIDASVILQPLSVRIPAGWSVRLLLASGDVSSFGSADSYEAVLNRGSSIKLPLKDIPRGGTDPN